MICSGVDTTTCVQSGSWTVPTCVHVARTSISVHSKYIDAHGPTSTPLHILHKTKTKNRPPTDCARQKKNDQRIDSDSIIEKLLNCPLYITLHTQRFLQTQVIIK